MATIFTHYYFQPWLLSNIIDNTTGKVPKYLHEFHVLERANIRIGVIGLAEKCVHSPYSRCALLMNHSFFFLHSREWIGTVPSWPTNFEYRGMEEVGKSLSSRLRDPEGEYKCDLIIALTHSR